MRSVEIIILYKSQKKSIFLAFKMIKNVSYLVFFKTIIGYFKFNIFKLEINIYFNSSQKKADTGLIQKGVNL